MRGTFTEDELDKIRQLRERFWKWYGPPPPVKGPSYILQPLTRRDTDDELLERWLRNDEIAAITTVMKGCNKLHKFLKESDL